MSRPQFQLGGQALIEGVMMRGPTHVGAAVRKIDGTILTRVEPFTSVLKKRPYLNIPFARGVIALFEMLGLGMSYLNWSSNIALEGEKEKKAQAERAAEMTANPAVAVNTSSSGGGTAVLETKTIPVVDPLVAAPVPAPIPAEGLDARSGEKALPVWMFLLTVAGSLGLGMGLFVALPNLITDWVFEPHVQNRIALNLLEGAVKLVIFVAYVWFIGQRKDIKRVFEYHGAEHKVVYAAENLKPITPDGARPYDTPHPRCGTGFALLTVFVSILCFSFLPWTESHLWRVLPRLLLLPVVAGISYEIIKATVNPKLSGFATLVVTPGMWLQRLTTRQPNDEQLEVACEAMRVLLEEENKARA